MGSYATADTSPDVPALAALQESTPSEAVGPAVTQTSIFFFLPARSQLLERQHFLYHQ